MEETMSLKQNILSLIKQIVSQHHGNSNTNGAAETFQNDQSGTFTSSSFPAGWLDTGSYDPKSTTSVPSAVVIDTNGPNGQPTKALATLPAVADSQGIYRFIEPTTTYRTTADIRIDQLSDVDPTGAIEDPNHPGFLLCGCPVETKGLLDWPIQTSFINLNSSVDDPVHAPAIALAPSANTDTWHLFAGTTNIVADIDLGLKIETGKWYGTELDFNANSSKLHGVITDATTGATLAEKTIFLHEAKYELFGAYDKNVDGVFNAEAFFDGELTLVFGTNDALNKPGLAVVDNIDVPSGFSLPDHGWNRVEQLFADRS